MPWKASSNERLANGEMTPQSDYYVPILRVLVRKGGRAKVSDLYRPVKKEMSGILKPVDYEHLHNDNPEPRWKHNMRAARKQMVDYGLLEPQEVAGFGNWQITSDGRRYHDHGEQILRGHSNSPVQLGETTKKSSRRKSEKPKPWQSVRVPPNVSNQFGRYLSARIGKGRAGRGDGSTRLTRIVWGFGGFFGFVEPITPNPERTSCPPATKPSRRAQELLECQQSH